MMHLTTRLVVVVASMGAIAHADAVDEHQDRLMKDFNPTAWGLNTSDVAALQVPFVDEELFQAIASEMGAFESRIFDVNTHRLEELKDHKEEFGERLLAQSEESKKTCQQNKRLVKDIRALKRENEFLRARAKSLMNDRTELSISLSSLEENLTMAQDFAARTVEKLAHAPSPELVVLHELSVRDAKRADDEARVATLREVSGVYESIARKAKATFLGVSANVKQGDLDDNEYESVDKDFRDMKRSISELKTSHSNAELSLKELFEVKYAEGAQLLKSVKEHQAILLAMKQKLVGLREQLGAAVQKLRQMNKYLLDQKHNVGQFVNRAAETLED